jgi:hypothetical protein
MSQPARSLVTVDALDKLEERAEVVGGELVIETMTTFEHSNAQLGVGAEVTRHFRGNGPGGKGGWWLGTEVTVLYGPRDGFRHDIAGWRKERVPVRPAGCARSSRPIAARISSTSATCSTRAACGTTGSSTPKGERSKCSVIPPRGTSS